MKFQEQLTLFSCPSPDLEPNEAQDGRAPLPSLHVDGEVRAVTSGAKILRFVPRPKKPSSSQQDVLLARILSRSRHF